MNRRQRYKFIILKYYKKITNKEKSTQKRQENEKTDVKLSDVTKIKFKNNDSVKRIMTFLY